jgi:predicted nucleic acid-binding protein
MTLVVDSSAVVAALIDAGSDGEWAGARLREGRLTAPSHLLVEVSDELRRAVLAGTISPDAAALAHDSLPYLRVTTFDFGVVAARVWDSTRTFRPMTRRTWPSPRSWGHPC